MKDYASTNIRNLAVVGHSGAGKTILTEAMLFNAGAINKMGAVESGSTVSDFDSEEQKRLMGISLTVNQVEYNQMKFNIIDAPGYTDFLGETANAVFACENSMLVVSADTGAGIGTEDAWDYAEKYGSHSMFFINKLDHENTDFMKTVEELKTLFGANIVPITIPVGQAEDFKGVVNVVTNKAYIYNGEKVSVEDVPADLADQVEEYRNALTEAAAETDEALMEKYFEEGALTQEELEKGLSEGIEQNSFIPAFAGSARSNIGVAEMMQFVQASVPGPDGFEYTLNDDETIKVSNDGAFCAYVFKSISDPYAGKLNYFKVIRGELTTSTALVNATQDRKEKLSHIGVSLGKEHSEVSKLCAGDIGVVSKMDDVHYGESLADAATPAIIKPVEFPRPKYTVAVEAENRKDEEKMGGNMKKLIADDPTMIMRRDSEVKQTLVSGLGEIQLDVLIKRIKERYGIGVVCKEKKIPYRETITKKGEGQGKYKKQSGGHGQYGDVHVRFEPGVTGSGFEFVDAIVGGTVPGKYIPSVEKGLRESFERGLLSGNPMIDVKATLFFGSYHSVDSSDMAFKMAASVVIKNIIPKCKPVILEPISKVEILVPESYMGDVMGDLNNKRGRILGMAAAKRGKQKISAEVPLAEMLKYPIELRSIAHGRGKYTIDFDHYARVPAEVQAKIMEDYQKSREED